MDRRIFLGSLIGGVAAGAAVRSWPFRVFSFPSAPSMAMDLESFTEIYVNPAMQSLFAEMRGNLLVNSEVMRVVSVNPLRVERGLKQLHLEMDRWNGQTLRIPVIANT